MQYIRSNQEVVKFKTLLEDRECATLFRHFKGKEYKIVTIAKDSETLGDIVIYQGQYEEKPCWTRKIDDFFSEVNKEKYPDIKQQYRFQIIEK